ncbi:TetR/AcrR family transcriptional regulator [Camelliibacillus cellulosilyticus]|uniref:TetR/AcrR family transcriptional regulator n=1 Tax=Camelliibacillus cellulosilyticus TaxID=2174486 RepID=A0ABV9GKB4_9BACL
MRERIIKGSIEEIQEKGMKFTMDDLSSRIGISKRTLYEQFSSKTEILEAIIDQTFGELDAKTQAIINDATLSLIGKIKEVFTILPTYYEIFDVRILEQMKKSFPAQWEKLAAELNSDWEELRALIEQATREGVIRPVDTDLLIKLMIDASNTTLDQRYFSKHNMSVETALESIIEILLYGLIPREKQ